MDRLSAGQGEALKLFKDVTNWHKDDRLAMVILQSVDWNVERAVTLHFETGTDEGSEKHKEEQDQEQEGEESPAAPTVTNDVRRPSVLGNVLVWSHSLLNSAFFLLSWLLPFLPRLVGYYPANRNATHAVSKSIDPKDVAARIVRTFEELYGHTNLNFFIGGYAEALSRSKEESKFLVVILQSEEHDATASFNKQVLTNPTVVDFLNRPDIITWLGNVQDAEAYQVANGLDCTRFPFVALIAPSYKTPEIHTASASEHLSSKSIVMSVLARLQGVHLDSHSMLSVLEERIQAYEPKISAIRKRREEHAASRLLRHEQDSAYAQSLAQDRERENRARDEALRRERAQQEELEQEQRLKEETNKREHWRRWRASQLVHESKLVLGRNENLREGHIGIRLASGTRVIQTFPPTSSLDDIYAFVDCYNELTQELYSTEKPANYTHEYGFELVVPIPRQVISSSDKRLSEVELLWPNGSLIVED